MRVLHGVADEHEEVEPLAQGEVVLLAELGQAHAAHEFHHEVGPARVGGAGIKHLGDVRMVHEREGLALGLEAGDDLPGVHAELDDLEGDAATDGFLLFGHEDHATTAFADLLEELVTTDTVAGLFGEGNNHGRRSGRTGLRVEGSLEEILDLAAGLQYGLDLSAQYGIARTGLVEPGGAFGGGEFEGGVENPHFLSFVLVHGGLRVDGSLLINAPFQLKSGHGK